jgi:hypothetical protein
MINTNSTIMTMNDREYSALQRATAQLRADQPEEKPKRVLRPRDKVPKSEHDFTYWDKQSLKWTVYVKFEGVKTYVGKTYYEDRIPAMKRAITKKLRAEGELRLA